MKRQDSFDNSASNSSETKQIHHQHSTKAFSSSDQYASVNLSGCSVIAIGDNAAVNVHCPGHSEQSAGGINIEPRKLKAEIRHQAIIYSREIQPPSIQLERAIVPVCLQIAREPVRVPNVLHAEGHLHRRKDIVKFYEHPPGDISEKEMFDLPKQQAQQEAERKNLEYDIDKREYTKTHGNVLAVIGWPGIGKTTSMKKWIDQILNGELVPGVTYVFFIFVRHIDFSKKMNVFQFLLSTIIDDWEHSTESDKAWLKKLVSDPNVLIALEGLDESAVEDLTIKAPKLNLYDTGDPLHIMLNLIGGKLLPLARIVISSRPDQLFHLHPEHRPKCIVQILGLNKDARDKLGHQIWGDRYELARVILEDNPDTFAYCFVPVNFLLTADYLMSEGKADSVCMTRVLASACKRYAVSDHLKGRECDLDKLSKLAWNGYKKMQIVFEEADLEEANIDKNTIFSFLNRSVVKSANIKMTIMDGDKRSSFSHLIWQEFMVAVHLLHYCTDEFERHLQHIHEDRWEVVAKFLFGLCNRDVFDFIRSFKGSCSKRLWLDKREQLKKVAIRRMKSLNQQLPARQDVESPQNRSLSVTASRCETSSKCEQPVMSLNLQTTAYSCQQPTTNQNLLPVSNEYVPAAPNQYQTTFAYQGHSFHPLCQSETSPYEQQAANQHVPVWARSHQQMVPQLYQNLMASQSQQLSPNQLMSNQPLCYPSYPSYQPMVNDYQQFAESLPKVCGNKYPPLAGSSHQQLGFNHDEQLRANPHSQPLADQHQLLLANQFANLQNKQFATNTNHDVQANLREIYYGNPLFHPASTHYHQVAANSHQRFASNKPHAVRPHCSIASQAPQLSPNQDISGKPWCHQSYPSYEHVANQYQQSAKSQYSFTAYNWQQPMTHQYEQLGRTQGWPVFETSHLRMDLQLHQNQMSKQSYQFPSNQFASCPHWHQPSHPGPQHMASHLHRAERTQHPYGLLQAKKYSSLAGTSDQQLGFNYVNLPTANPHSQPMANQHQVFLASQFQHFETHNNQQFPTNLHKIHCENPFFHPVSAHYQQAAANFEQGFASKQPHSLKPHQPIAIQASLSATQHLLKGFPLSDNDKWKTLLQVCSWIHEVNDEDFTRDVVAHLPDDIMFPSRTILPSDVSNLFYALRSSPKSHTLKVDNCNFTGNSLKIFLKEVSSPKIKIQHFWLDGKKLSNDEFSSIIEFSQLIEELRLTSCGITSCQVSSLAKKLIETGHTIQFLNLSDNMFGDEGFSNLALCLKSIRKLRLMNCNISSAGCAKFAEKLIGSEHKIQHLNLGGNKFGDVGFFNLTLCLKNIQKLVLNKCGISSAGCAKFAEQLIETGHKIQHLNLGGNKFSDKGFSNLALCLKNVQKLVLKDCDISSAGCAKFAEKLIEGEHKLKYLDLSGNKLIGNTGSRSLISCLHLIEELDLRGCNVTEAVKEEIRSELKRLGLPENRAVF